MNPQQLDKNIEKLQAESVNNGGIFRFLELPITESANLVSSLLEKSHSVKLVTIPNDQSKELISDQIEHWSMYSGPCPERHQNSPEFTNLKTDFIKDLYDFLNTNCLLNVYQVECLDSWLNVIIDSGIDHMNEDFIFQTTNSCYILHLGFSS